MSFFVIELTSLSPEVTEVYYKHFLCPRCGERPIARVGHTGVHFRRKSEATDFCWTDEGLLVRRKVVQKLIDERVSGWRQGYVVVEATPKLRQEDIDYHELIITGHTRKYAEIVGLEIREQCMLCRIVNYHFPEHGLLVPEECWDGSDIFVIDELPGMYLVTEAVRNIIEMNQFTGISLIPTTEWHAPLWAQRS